MNNFLLLCSLFLILNATTQKEQKELRSNQHQKENTLGNINDSYLTNTTLIIEAEGNEETLVSFIKEKKEREPDLASITYIEEEEEINLGFNTKDYLPRGFNAYETYFDIHSVTYIEDKIEFDFYFDIHTVNYIEEEEISLVFNTKDYLPKGFNAYETYFDIHSVTYIEDEIEFDFYFDIHTVNYIEEEDKESDLAFNTAGYLPRGFNAYETYFDIHSVTYIEDEIKFDFYFDIHTVNYVEDEVEVKLNFKTKKYLPKGFNAYAKPSVL